MLATQMALRASSVQPESGVVYRIMLIPKSWLDRYYYGYYTFIWKVSQKNQLIMVNLMKPSDARASHIDVKTIFEFHVSWKRKMIGIWNGTLTAISLDEPITTNGGKTCD